MASKTSETNNNDDKHPFTIRTTLDNDDDSTEMDGSKRGKNDGTEQEKLVKWQIPGHHDNNSARKTLLSLLIALLVNHPKEVTFIDRRQREWQYSETEDEGRFTREFESATVRLHAIKDREKKVVKWIAITKFLALSSPQEWKNTDQFYETITENKTYIFPHPFGQDDWEIASIGFIKNIHAIHYPRELLHEQITEMLENENKKIPTFQLIPQRVSTMDKTASTKAFAVQCLKDDADQMIHLLTHGPFREPSRQIFVPFKYKENKPDTFAKCIRQQNELYHKTWIIKVEGLTPAAMECIEQEITTIMGVWHIVPSKRTEEIGEWKILTDQSKCAYIHRQMTNQWQKIISRIPTEILDEAPMHFSMPMISSKRARDYQDNESTHLIDKHLRRPHNDFIDNEWKGDDLSNQKDNRTTRIMYHNVNGLSIRGTDGLDMFVNEQVNNQVDIQCFTEHCLDTTKFQVIQCLQTRRHRDPCTRRSRKQAGTTRYRRRRDGPMELRTPTPKKWTSDHYNCSISSMSKTYQSNWQHCIPPASPCPSYSRPICRSPSTSIYSRFRNLHLQPANQATRYNIGRRF